MEVGKMLCPYCGAGISKYNKIQPVEVMRVESPDGGHLILFACIRCHKVISIQKDS